LSVECDVCNLPFLAMNCLSHGWLVFLIMLRKKVYCKMSWFIMQFYSMKVVPVLWVKILSVRDLVPGIVNNATVTRGCVPNVGLDFEVMLANYVS